MKFLSKALVSVLLASTIGVTICMDPDNNIPAHCLEIKRKLDDSHPHEAKKEGELLTQLVEKAGGEALSISDQYVRALLPDNSELINTLERLNYTLRSCAHPDSFAPSTVEKQMIEALQDPLNQEEALLNAQKYEAQLRQNQTSPLVQFLIFLGNLGLLHGRIRKIRSEEPDDFPVGSDSDNDNNLSSWSPIHNWSPEDLWPDEFN